MSRRDPDQPDQSYIDLLIECLDPPMKRIRDLILNPKGGSPDSIVWNQTRSISVINQVNEVMQRAGVNVARWSSRALTNAARQGWTAASQQILSLGMDAPLLKVSFAQVDTDQLNLLVRDSHQDLQLALDSTRQDIQRTLVQMGDNGLTAREVNKMASGALIEGKPILFQKQLTARLQEIHGETLTVGGRHFESKEYAQLVSQTRMRQASVLSRHERLQRQGIDYVVIIGNVTKWPCTAFLGKIYYIGVGQDPEGKYPNIDTVRTARGYPAPPFHPNCSKSTAPIVIELATKEQLHAGIPDMGSEKMAEIGVTGAEATRLFQDRQLFAAAESRMKKITRSLQ
jgi:hypothetical protein